MADYTPTTEEVRRAYSLTTDMIGYETYGAAERAEFDRWLVAHDAEVRASVLAKQGEPEGRRWFSAAYRAWNGNVIPIGLETVIQADAAAVRDEFRREDPEGPDYFLATRILPPWEPVEENTPHTEGNGER